MIRRRRRTAALSPEALADQLQRVPDVETLIAFRDRKAAIPVQTISTGCPSLDWAIRRGGWPRRRLSILWGAEGAGKTTLALHSVAQVQEQGGFAIYMDTEYKLDPMYAQALGVDVNSLIISHPRYIESAFILMRKAMSLVEGADLILVLDSMTALRSRYEAELEEKEADRKDKNKKPATPAQAISDGLRNLVAALHKSEAVMLWISQTRVKFGSKYEQITGGNAPKFYASIMTRLRHIGGTVDDKSGIGVEALVVKNSIATPFRRGEFFINFGEGIDKLDSLIRVGVEIGIVKLSGGWYSFNRRKYQGINKFKKAIIGTSLEKELYKSIYSEMK